MRQMVSSKENVGKMVQRLIDAGCTIFGIVFVKENNVYVISYM